MTDRCPQCGGLGVVQAAGPSGTGHRCTTCGTLWERRSDGEVRLTAVYPVPPWPRPPLTLRPAPVRREAECAHE